MPFSDPMADGPAVQASSLRALKSGQTMQQDARAGALVPRAGPGHARSCCSATTIRSTSIRGERFLDDAKAAGVDGLIIVDLPPEADEELCLPAIARGLNFIRLATPTTDAKRLPAVLANTSGFLYYVSITGITGTAAPDVAAVHAHIARIKKATRLPVAVGFGVTTPPRPRRSRPAPTAWWWGRRWLTPFVIASVRTAKRLEKQRPTS